MEEVSRGLVKATMELRRLGIFKSVNITCGSSPFTQVYAEEAGRSHDGIGDNDFNHNQNSFLGGVLGMDSEEEEQDVIFTDLTIEVVEKGLLGLHAGTYMQGETV